ncbi:4-alpha-glucanotransferase [Hydrogenovibrio marinus]|uniref:4-alpha-glucanotransferase n=1 Tax=Hydrogenovibrio marinus TaxID=28885 RepID=A0A066ZSN0_HYDMR|nr:4-alpha-glucanotransferase [Hydrogenovibrio marinus]KDN95264.1 4-alpha-glucanotransferase [Hydrogenovibrio marinus]BBN59742.1 4-alpha-glucanotransferase [Hydrogenovibrio marinus]
MSAAKRAGVLLHPTSLPHEGSLGRLDKAAWQFLDWMQEAGLSVWQMLPLTQPVQGLSPYQSVSAFAMNPALLPEDWQEQFDATAFDAFLQDPPHWLDDYALFMTLREVFNYEPWSSWPDVYQKRDLLSLANFAQQHQEHITFLKKEQFVLGVIWQKLKADANAKGIMLFGDMPIFVAYDSADVWANPDQFKLDEHLKPTVVAGVPPDYFSETGQHWGNPHYNWEVMLEDDFDWWHKRIAQAISQFDFVRIDHFRGLEACWEIDAKEETAMNGEWRKVPGDKLLSDLHRNFPHMNLVAEDLGVITPEVVALKEAFNLPGMSVLQFGFNGLPDNPHDLKEQVENSIVYTGTHDNDTTLGWWDSLDDETRHWVDLQLADFQFAGDMPWPLIAAAMSSPALTMIAPLQDYLGLATEARMNIPGTCDGNWAWQFEWQEIPNDLSARIKTLIKKYERIA